MQPGTNEEGEIAVSVTETVASCTLNDLIGNYRLAW